MAYTLAIERSSHPAYVGKLDPPTRSIFYGSLATSAGALLGFTIASIAILTTLDPERKQVADMQSLRAWKILHVTFLTAAVFLAVTLAVATAALAVDARTAPREWLEEAVVIAAAVAFAELVVAGLAFALVVMNVVSRKP